jgi:feruloyl-CoA synthase
MNTAMDKVRAVNLRRSGATMERRADGSFIIRPEEPLEDYPRVLTERLIYWAGAAPDRALAAKRHAGGPWRYLSYGEALQKVRSLGQAFLDRGLSADRPIAILSDNDLEHLLLMFAGQHVGIPTASIAPAYSLVSTDFAKLKHVMKILRPGMVFVSSSQKYRRALDAAVDSDIEIVFAEEGVVGRNSTSFDDLCGVTPTEAVDAAYAAIKPDDVAKFLFSSGSTGLPKAVINTHRMICSNQQMILQGFRFLSEAPPIVVDWMPWNHTAGGNHNTGMTVYNGGTLYIDDGRPTSPGIAETVRNLREIAPTVYFNMPRGYDLLLACFRDDAKLRENFFSRLKFMFYAGAALSQPLWDAYRKLMMEACGERILMATGLGATETSPMHVGFGARRRNWNPDAGRGSEARAFRGQIGNSGEGPERDAWILARPGTYAARLRRRGLLQIRRCRSVRGPGGRQQGPFVRWALRGRFQTGVWNVCKRRPLAHQDHPLVCALCD